MFCVFETGRPRRSRIRGTRGQRPPQEASWGGLPGLPSHPEVHIPDPSPQWYMLLVGVSGWGWGFWGWKLLAGIPPALLEGGLSFTNNEQKASTQLGESWQAEALCLGGPSDSPADTKQPELLQACSCCRPPPAAWRRRRAVLKGNPLAAPAFSALPLSPLVLCVGGRWF